MIYVTETVLIPERPTYCCNCNRELVSGNAPYLLLTGDGGPSYMCRICS